MLPGGFGVFVPDWRDIPGAAFSLPVSFRFTDKDEGIVPLLMIHMSPEHGPSSFSERP